MKGKTRETKYAKKANQMIDKVIGKSNRKKMNKAVGSLIGEGSPSAKVSKMSMGGKAIAGTLSPVYGMATGEGLFGEGVGLLPAAAKQARKRKNAKEEAKQQAVMSQAAPKAMKKGGKVKYCADGCAIKGKTRAKMK